MSVPASEGRQLGAAPVFLLAVAAVCWAVTVDRMRGMDMGPATDLGGLGWFAVVWITMMTAMMLPSAAPMAVAGSGGVGASHARSIAGTTVFAMGYLLPWAAFGVLAYALVEGVRSLDPSVLAWGRAGQYLAGGVIVGAAIYELTSTKRMYLRRCRDKRLLRRRPGYSGAIGMGLEQGRCCIGSSGALMIALFALGVMSVAWMVVIATAVAIEKLLPWTRIAIGATAAALALLGVAVILAPAHVPWLTLPMSMR